MELMKIAGVAECGNLINLGKRENRGHIGGITHHNLGS